MRHLSFYGCLMMICPVHAERNPFAYEDVNELPTNGIVATALYDESQKIYFKQQSDSSLHIVCQQKIKSPSTLEKAEGLGG